MKKLLLLPLLSILLYSCGTDIKNRNAEVIVEEGTEVSETTPKSDELKTQIAEEASNKLTPNSMLGYWVGSFEKDNDNDDYNYEKAIYVDDGYLWMRENKINISIDEINGNQVKGHSVVAGNDRPFEGTMEKVDNSYYFEVEEPGDHKYDGKFIFSVFPDQLTGTWTAFKNIDIKKRKYQLEKKTFSYNPDIMLEHAKEYIDWGKYLEKKETYDVGDDEFEEWISREFAAATHKIYEINASSQVLTKTEVENLKKGDLTIIRNAIYARHGYSFKNRPMRVFFDAQEWYIPVHTDIKSDFTDIEKENIKLLLRYEKNAAEYYDHFGRG
ncbi:MAG: YARHG domain-containing protein [Saprospiraceae bacterium]